ncbi:MAG: glycosyltransferase [Fimbriimonadaceae bacterium]|nr:glycosyltransferase [Fimbriimonadaceae bacterium]
MSDLNSPLVVHLVHSLGWGGLERVVLDLCRSTAALGWRSAVVSLSNDIPRQAQFAAFGVPVEVVPQRGLDASLPWRLATRLRALGAAVVQAHNFGRYFYGGPAARLAGLASLYTEHSNTLPHERALLLAQPLLSRLAGRVVAVSETVRSTLIAAHGLAPERVRTIPNGIDTAVYASGQGPTWRQRHGLAAATPLVVHVGRLVAVKNQALLLQAFARLHGDPPPVLLMAGDGELRGALQRLSGELGIADRVRWLGVCDDVADVLAAGDLFALSSTSEGLPLAILEAFAAGRPVVATAGAGKDLVTAATGLLTPTGAVEPFAAALQQLLDDPQRRREMGQQAAQTAARRYSLRAMATAYAAVYEDLLRASRDTR